MSAASSSGIPKNSTTGAPCSSTSTGGGGGGTSTCTVPPAATVPPACTVAPACTTGGRAFTEIASAGTRTLTFPLHPAAHTITSGASNHERMSDNPPDGDVA